MKSTILSILLFAASGALFAQKPSNIRVNYSDRFIQQDSISITDVDSIEFLPSRMTLYRHNASGEMQRLPKSYYNDATYGFGDFQRVIVKPNMYSGIDYTNEASKFCFQRSQESEHFICFWEKGLTKLSSGLISNNGYSINVNLLLKDAEKIWDTYINKLGFLTPGNSTTDKAKIEMYIVNQKDWRADGSGDNGVMYYMQGTTKKERQTKVGLFHCNTWAATARSGHTVAHEIGHTFQYLVSADLGMTHGLNYVLGENSKGNEWWEDCANWQAYKVYPNLQFTDGEYFEQYMNLHHLNIHHEAARYANCFYHDWWCQQHGMNTIGRVWREAVVPEDPTQAYMRIFGLNEQSFADDMYQCFAHMTTIDIDGVRDQGKGKIGKELNRLINPSASIVSSHLNGEEGWHIVDPAYCVQNYGYNANPLTVPAAGTVVTAEFRGLSNVPGYRSVRPECAGWRYGIVAYCSNGLRYYSEMGSEREGTITFTVPERCTKMWFVVMGAPTNYWTHSWNDDDSDDEQWPYAVKFTGTQPIK